MAKLPNKHTTRQRNYRRLRRKFDADDPIAGQMKIVGRGHSAHNQRVENAPDWAMDDAKVKEILLRAFPHMETNPLQRKRAGKWMRIIYQYFRTGDKAFEISLEFIQESGTALALYKKIEALQWKATRCRFRSDAYKRIMKRIRRLRLQERRLKERSLKRVTDTIARIELAAQGLRTDGKPRVGKFGRPKKV